ncbi:large ribosomal subunit protein uL1-like [Oratosquilla oratoria]|uniref:large ribosomal subunit protein uL1-like n=1 Tax=Oratosquilla oratoria TaxID=337810 RepID=UPI003F769965
MAVVLQNAILKSLTHKCLVPLVCVRAGLETSSVLEAARKGTRAKAEAKKKAAKKEAVKKEFIPYRERLEQRRTGIKSPRRVEDHLKTPIDDVWITKFYKWKVYEAAEAIAMHRESHHPTILNSFDSLITAKVELDISLDKKNRYLDRISNVIRLPYDFPLEHNRSILVLTQDIDMQQKARELGADLAVGTEIIKMVQSGEFSLQDFHHVLAHPDLLQDLLSIKGMLKRKFPNVKSGTAGEDLVPIIERFTLGVDYSYTKHKHDPSYALIEVPFGSFHLSDEQLKANLSTILQDIESHKSNRKSTDLITMVCLTSRPSSESFKIDHKALLEESEDVKIAARA